MTAAIVACLDCATARARCRETGDTYVCTCGRTYRSRMLVYRADPDAPQDAPAPLDRAGHAALRLAPHDPELARVRALLADLRPDCADPWVPPQDAPAQTPTVRVRDPHADWGGIPRGLESPMGAMLARAEAASVCAADILAAIDALPADAAAVLRWLRRHGDLRAGLRGLYADAGVAFATAAQTTAWVDLGARRTGAPDHGRRMVLAAAREWDARTPPHPGP